MTRKKQITLAREAFDLLLPLDNLSWHPYVSRLLAMCKEEEKAHRGFGTDFNAYHPNAATLADCAKAFAVKRIAEYLLGDPMPKGKDFLHCQKSCFQAAGLVNEYRKEIQGAWAGIDYAQLRDIDYVVLVGKATEPATA